MDGADDGEPVFRLRVADRVATGEDRTCRTHHFVRACQHLAEDIDRELLGERRHRERKKRRTPHRKDVVERVRRRDAAEEGGVVVQAIDRGIVCGIEPHEQVVCVHRREPGEQRLEARRRVLGCATARTGKRGERDKIRHESECTHGRIDAVRGEDQAGKSPRLLLSP